VCFPLVFILVFLNMCQCHLQNSALTWPVQIQQHGLMFLLDINTHSGGQEIYIFHLTLKFKKFRYWIDSMTSLIRS
jgi:hypothetical protein